MKILFTRLQPERAYHLDNIAKGGLDCYCGQHSAIGARFKPAMGDFSMKKAAAERESISLLDLDKLTRNIGKQARKYGLELRQYASNSQNITILILDGPKKISKKQKTARRKATEDLFKFCLKASS